MHVCKSERLNTKDQSLRTEKGFTLIELSIVIVIIGLIVAGVVGGQALVKQAKLRQVTSTLTNLEVAVNTFFLEYNSIIGDMPNAWDYFGCGANANECNGDGDNKIEWGTPDAAVRGDREFYRTWTHLNDSKLFPNTLDGTGGAVSNLNSLEGAFVNSIYIFQHHPTWLYNRSNNHLLFMEIPPEGNWWGVLDVKDAHSVDKKIDDGVANQGKLLGLSGDGLAANSCSDRKGAGSGANYNLSSSVEKSCYLAYELVK